MVKQNNVFGNYKWGVASFSGPGEIFVANEGDEAKNVNNQILENSMGRDGADPNGEYDFWNDATGGGNCWGGNTAGSSFAPGNGTSAAGARSTRPARRPPVEYDQVSSLNIGAGLQINLANESRPEDDPRLRRLDARRRTSSAPGSAGSPNTRRSKSSSRSRSPPQPGEVTCK